MVGQNSITAGGAPSGFSLLARLIIGSAEQRDWASEKENSSYEAGGCAGASSLLPLWTPSALAVLISGPFDCAHVFLAQSCLSGVHRLTPDNGQVGNTELVADRPNRPADVEVVAGP